MSRSASRTLAALGALTLGLTGCRGCWPHGRTSARFDGGPGDPVAVEPGALSPDLRFDTVPEVAAPPTTPQASEGKRPSFASKSEGYGPSLTDAHAEQLYTELIGAPRRVAEGAVGVLACHFETTARVKQGLSGLIGAYTAPTVTLDVDFNSAHVVRAGESGTPHIGFTVPLVTLSPTSVFVVSALGTKVPVALSPRGLFEGKRDEHSVSCAFMPHAEAEQRLMTELPSVTRALRGDALDAHLIDTKARGFGQAALVRELDRQTTSLAALVGWADPRVVRRTEWAERILRHHRGQVAAAIAKWPPGPAALEDVGSLAPGGAYPPCSKKERDAASAMVVEIFRPKEPCAFRVAFTPAADTKFVADVFFKKTSPEVVADIVLEDGEVLESAWTLPEGAFRNPPEAHNERFLDPGVTAFLHFGVAANLEKRTPHVAPLAIVVRAGERVARVAPGLAGLAAPRDADATP